MKIEKMIFYYEKGEPFIKIDEIKAIDKYINYYLDDVKECNKKVYDFEGHRHGGKGALVHQEGYDGHRTAHSEYPGFVLTVLSRFRPIADSSHGDICKSIHESCNHHDHAYNGGIDTHNVRIELQKKG